MCLPGLAVIALSVCAQVPVRGQANVPFMGCKSDGQTGPLAAPSEPKEKAVAIPPEAARQLAYYRAAQGPGVVAPRGWHCFGTYGSSGTRLFVSPQPIETAHLFSAEWPGLRGPAIEVDDLNGGTSGRFSVAAVIARVFPAHIAVAKRVMREMADAGQPPLPSGPYPADALIYRSDRVVEYTTPAGMDGLGTRSALRKDGSPIQGVAILMGRHDPDVLVLAVRLPSAFGGLVPAILGEMERDSARHAREYE